jgi:hypothetical protein
VKVVITSLYTDREFVVEGSERAVELQLRLALPWLRSFGPPRGDLQTLLEYLAAQQAFLVNILRCPS